MSTKRTWDLGVSQDGGMRNHNDDGSHDGDEHYTCYMLGVLGSSLVYTSLPNLHGNPLRIVQLRKLRHRDLK